MAQVTPLMVHMKAMGPSALDGECSSLGPEGGGSLEQLANFMRFLLSGLKRKENFELVEAYLSLFMKVSSAILCSNIVLMCLTLSTTLRPSLKSLSSGS